MKLPFLSAGSIPCVQEGGGSHHLTCRSHTFWFCVSLLCGGRRADISGEPQILSPFPSSLCVGGGLCGTVTHYSTQEKREKGEKGGRAFVALLFASSPFPLPVCGRNKLLCSIPTAPPSKREVDQYSTYCTPRLRTQENDHSSDSLLPRGLCRKENEGEAIEEKTVNPCCKSENGTNQPACFAPQVCQKRVDNLGSPSSLLHRDNPDFVQEKEGASGESR